MTLQLDYDYIDSNEMLAQFCAGLSTATYCVIDTEFGSDCYWGEK